MAATYDSTEIGLPRRKSARTAVDTSALLSTESFIPYLAILIWLVYNYVIEMNRLETVKGQLSHPRKFEYTVDGGCLTL